MAKRKYMGPKPHKFRDKLLLNQWLMSLFGIDPLRPACAGTADREGAKKRPFHKLAEPIRDPRLEGLDTDNLHNFYHALVNSNLFWDDVPELSKAQLLAYEENIVHHAQGICVANKSSSPFRAFAYRSNRKPPLEFPSAEGVRL